MGKEHSLMDRLAVCAAAVSPTGKALRGTQSDRLPFAKFGFGEDTPNQKALTVAVWILEAQLAGDTPAPEQIARAIEFYSAMRHAGHWSIGRACEVGTASHRQLWYAAMAGALLGAVRAESETLRDLVIDVWRCETGSFGLCGWIDDAGFQVLTPGARNGRPDKPATINSLGDKVMYGLVRGWASAPRQGRDSYDVAIPLLSQVFSSRFVPVIRAMDLWGSFPMSDFGFRRWIGTHGGEFYSWFEHLPRVDDPLYGAGRIAGETVLHWTRDEAVAFGRSLAG